MARFSLSPKAQSFNAPIHSQNDVYDDSSDNSSSEEPVYDESDDSEEEEEEAHPLGFPGYNLNRIGLIRGTSFRRTTTTMNSPQTSRNFYSTPNYQDIKVTQEIISPRVVRNQPHLDTKTPVLLKHHYQVCLSNQSSKHETLSLQEHLTSLSIHNHSTVSAHTDTYKSPLQAVQDLMRNERDMRNDLARKREKIEQEQRLAVQSFLQLLQEDERDAAMILERERKQQEEYHQQVEEEEKITEHRRQLELSKEKEKQLLEEEKRQIQQNQQRLKLQEEERERLEQMKKKEYITVALQMVDKVKLMREQLEKFEKNTDKGISKRRLEMKKIARGKLNTLSHDKDKIVSVAQDIVAAIHSVMQEDRILTQQLGSSHGDNTPTLGTSYFMDLIASNVIVRIQAEGFNGTRGDGFPLASLLTLVSTQIPEDFITLLQSHIFMVCPTAIPSLPKPLPGSSETDLMESLGMIKDKNGEYESFERFLGRTEGIISMIGAIMASVPNNHKLFGGKDSALQWLERFTDLLSNDDNPLPLLTAPVLVAYLTSTGHMLAKCFREPFQSMLGVITSNIFPRLDNSTIGQPSATRLKKLLGSGINGFISDLPNGALADLYNANIPISSGSELIISQRESNQLLFQHQSTMQMNTNQGSSDYSQQGPAFKNTLNTETMDSSIDISQPETSALSFGTSNLSASHQPSTQPAISHTSPFTAFGAGNMTSNQQSPFGMGSTQFSSSVSTFGVNQTLQGSQLSSFGIGFTKASPFSNGSSRAEGQPFAVSNTSPFGGVSQAQPAVASPFGSSFSAPNTFSSSGLNSFNSVTSSSPSPFGNSKNILNTTPAGVNAGFGTFGNISNQADNRNKQTPFGFGGGTSKPPNAISASTRPPCKFFQQGKCRNGDYCNFSHSVQGNTPFSRTGPVSNNSPFGAPRR